MMKKFRFVLLCAAIFAAVATASRIGAQESESKSATPKAGEPPSASPAQEAKSGKQYSGMYSFMEDGEFVQITVEDAGKVTGFVSRYGDEKSDKGAFLDQYFRSGKLEGNKLTFVTETVQAVWFEFKGTVERGEGKAPGDEGYYVLKGTLIDSSSDMAKKVTSHSREVVLKMFPRS